MVEKIVLTGGPGTGKSSIILALEFLGEYVIHEAAEDYIKLRQANGVEKPWLDPDFQLRILDLQYLREGKIPGTVNRIFIDRGYHDGLAFVDFGSNLYKRIYAASKFVKYDYVFLIEQLGFTKQTKIRRENHEGAVAQGNKLEQIYKEFGHNVMRINEGSVDSRVEKILTHLYEANNNKRF